MTIRIDDAVRAIAKASKALTANPESHSRRVRHNRRAAMRAAVKSLLRVMDRDYPNIARVVLVESKPEPKRGAVVWERKMRKHGWGPLKSQTPKVVPILWRSLMAAGIKVKVNPYSEKGDYWIPAWTLGAYDAPTTLKRAKRSVQERRSLLVVAAFQGLL